jgi:hypothetical protein
MKSYTLRPDTFTLNFNLLFPRWANYALSLPPDEPMLPLFWQGFFSLFFARYMSLR